MHLNGELDPIFPTRSFGFSYHVAAHKVFFGPSDDSLVISCLLFSVPLSDGIKHSGS